MLFKALKAPSVKMTNLPTYPPGANYKRLSLLTLAISTPGTFLKALLKVDYSLEYTKSGPFLNLYLLFLSFPFPALMTLESTTF